MNQSFFLNINPVALLITSRAIAALRPALIAFLVVNGTRLSGGIETPISFCNVLFVGNLCAAISVAFWFGFKDIIKDLKTLHKKIIFSLFIDGCFASLLSALIFMGLEFTTVTNSILLGRLGPVLFALAGTIMLGKKITSWQWLGFSLIIFGVIAIVFKTNMYQINKGDLFIIASAFVYAITYLIGKLFLAKECSLRVIVFTRNLVSSLVFFIIASIQFGPSHFGDVFSGQLWIIMSIYALIIIVFAQLLWYAALEKLDSQTVGRWTVLSPIFGILYALILNGERPSSIQYSAFAVIIIGVLISSLGKKKTLDKEIPMDKDMQVECTASAS